MLVESFLQRGGPARQRIMVEAAALARLRAHHWPGNIRELRNVLDRARLFADDGVVRAEYLPDDFGFDPTSTLAAVVQMAPAPRRQIVTDAEMAQIAVRFDGTRRELAQSLGLSERTLYRRLKAPGIA